MTQQDHTRSRLVLVFSALAVLMGIGLGAGGLWLAILGGSWYYLVAGIVLLAVAVLLYRRKPAALWLYTALLVGTMAWALWEVGLDFWALTPRGGVLTFFGILLATPWLVRRLDGEPWPGKAWPLLAALGLAALVVVLALFQNPHDLPGRIDQNRLLAAVPEGAAREDWTAYGGSSRGNRWSALNQITPQNVARLQKVWEFHTGDLQHSTDPGEFTYEVTPIKVGSLVYLCSPHNIVFALDAETGRQVWRFDPHIHASQDMQHLTCRGVSYYSANAPGGTKSAAGDCPDRIIMGTNDARLIALDAHTGLPCQGFGNKGEVDVWPGPAGVPRGWWQITSPPVISHNLAIFGGAVYDNKSTFMPSGVIRAFDVITGREVWAFDPGNPGNTQPQPPGAGRFVPSSPNTWSIPSADDGLGLVYFPMGMAAIDQWGGERTPETERLATSVLALDVTTGRPRWAFQTVHHDLWDMDVPAQPVLVDLDLPGRGKVPALVQSTKTGNIFVLDRRTGQPIFPVTERRVPGSPAAGDRLSPTQPFSSISLMPPVRAAGSNMWGATMFDQLACRIKFSRLRYEGPFTPPSTQGTLVFPGNFGVMDWGGIAIDPVRMVAFAHPNYMAFVDRLVPRLQSDTEGPPSGNQVGPAGGSDMRGSDIKGYNPNTGAPFAVALNPFLSGIGLPCQAPPWGYVAAIDLRTGKVAWEHRNGTSRDQGPVPLPFKLGVPSLGGPMMTAGGVAFMGSTLDYYLRAYDVATGDVLWRGRLPAGGQATPMSYWSGASGRQFVVIAAGGHSSLGTRMGDSIVAYALPRGG